MSFADCTACVRRHKRPANTKCEYAKVAVEKCVSLGLKSSDYMLHLPDLLPEDMDPKAGRRPSKPDLSTVHESPSTGKIDNELIARLVSESVHSRKLLESSQGQVERMMAQLLDMKIDQSRSRPTVSAGATAAVPAQSPAASPQTAFPPGHGTVQTTAGPLSGHVSTWAGYTVPYPGMVPPVGASQPAQPPVSSAGATWSFPPSSPTVVGETRPAIPANPPVNPYLPPYLLPGAAQQASLQVPYRCETDHVHPPRHSCTTAKRKLVIYDLEVHMRYASSVTATLEDIIAASLSLLESMLRQGVECAGYVRHIRFLVEKSKIYHPSSLIGYDAELRERAEFYGSSVFTYGDHDLTHRWLGVDSLKSISQTGQSATQSQSGSKKRSLRSTKYGSCWSWNENKSCKTTPCRFKHVCSSCQADHKQVDCTVKAQAPAAPKVSE